MRQALNREMDDQEWLVAQRSLSTASCLIYSPEASTQTEGVYHDPRPALFYLLDRLLHRAIGGVVVVDAGDVCDEGGEDRKRRLEKPLTDTQSGLGGCQLLFLGSLDVGRCMAI